MAVNPKVQLTRLALGMAGAAALAGLAGRFATGPATVAAATDETALAPAEGVAEPPAPSFFSWFDDDDDDDDGDDDEYEERKERGHHAREQGQFQFAPAESAGTGSTVPGTQQPRSTTRRS